MRVALTLSLLSLAWVGVASAQGNAPALAGQAPSSLASAPASAPDAPVKIRTAKRARNGKRQIVASEKRTEPRRGGTSVQDALTTCLAMWEPATHMTKRAWARACRRVAERLKETKAN